MHETLYEIETALKSAERQIASALLALNRINRKCRQCGEPLDSGEVTLCEWCFRALAVRDAEVVS